MSDVHLDDVPRVDQTLSLSTVADEADAVCYQVHASLMSVARLLVRSSPIRLDGWDARDPPWEDRIRTID